MLFMIYKRLNDIGYTEAKFCTKLEILEKIIELNVAIKTGELHHRNGMQATRCRISYSKRHNSLPSQRPFVPCGFPAG